MPQEIHTWNDYRATVREFDAVLEHGKAVAAGLGEPPPSEPHVGYGEQIFVKLLSHCVALRRLTPNPTQGPPATCWTCRRCARCRVASSTPTTPSNTSRAIG